MELVDLQTMCAQYLARIDDRDFAIEWMAGGWAVSLGIAGDVIRRLYLRLTRVQDLRNEDQNVMLAAAQAQLAELQKRGHV